MTPTSYKIAATLAAGLLVLMLPRPVAVQSAPPETVVRVTSAETTQAVQAPDYTYYDIPLSRDLQQHIQVLCRAYSLPPELVYAVIAVESDYKADAIGQDGDYGLMQVRDINLPELRELLGIEDAVELLDPYTNVHAGIYYLHKAAQYADTVSRLLMVYNMGLTGARRAWAQGVLETEYTRKVINVLEGG